MTLGVFMTAVFVIAFVGLTAAVFAGYLEEVAALLIRLSPLEPLRPYDHERDGL